MNIRATKQGEHAREKVLKAIAEYVEVHKYAPSVRELCDMTGYKSTSSVQTHLSKMLDEGLIETDHGFNVPRALRISDTGRKRLEEMNA